METKNNPKISLIVAIAKGSRTIGKEGGGIPWHISEDFKDFKNKTTGHPMIMGRVTWELFGGKPLPNRTSIVVTNNPEYKVPEGHFVCGSIEAAIEKASELDSNEIFVIGGASIYEATMKYADRIYVTIVDVDIDGPAKFPDYVSAGFTKIISSRKSSEGDYKYEFQIVEKN